jgi:hypothetical protein
MAAVHLHNGNVQSSGRRFTRRTAVLPLQFANDLESALPLHNDWANLVFAYLARRTAGKPQRNITLHLSVIFGMLLQLATVFVPGLRVLLGRELPDALAFVWVASAILLSWGVAETYGRLAVTPRAEFMNKEQIPK